MEFSHSKLGCLKNSQEDAGSIILKTLWPVMGHVLVSSSQINQPKVPSSFEVPPLPTLNCMYLGSLREAFLH